MAQARPAIDPFGLGRLSDTLRQNRLDQEQTATRGLQQQLLSGQVQQQQQSLADLATARQDKADFQTAMGQETGQSQTLKAIDFFRERNPQKAQDLINETITTAGNIAKFSGQGAIDFVNKGLGTKWKLDSEDDETVTIDQGDKKVLINKASGEVIKEFSVTKQAKQLTPQQLAFSKLSPEQQAATFLKSGETIEMTPEGGFKITRGDVGGQKPPKFSEVQSKSGGFADRVKRANKIANDLEDTEGFDPAKIGESIATSIPLIGNALLSPEKQKYEQSKRDFVSAVLRLESGAAIAQSEFDSANKLYFPQVGDSPEVIAQKRASRDFQFDILKAAGAGSFENIQSQRESDMQGETPKISNIEQFNALPSGTIYQQEDGQTFQKP